MAKSISATVNASSSSITRKRSLLPQPVVVKLHRRRKPKSPPCPCGWETVDGECQDPGCNGKPETIDDFEGDEDESDGIEEPENEEDRAFVAHDEDDEYDEDEEYEEEDEEEEEEDE